MNTPKTPHHAELFSSSDISVRTDVRWWMAAGMHTNETVLEELHAMHAAGFSGVELCQLADRTIDEHIYGYGGAQWENDVKLILHTALDLGMSVSLTSGAGWSTANVPGLDPDAQAANQCVVLLTEDLCAGETRQGPIPTDGKLRPKAVFIGAAALRKAGDAVYAPDGVLVLTDRVVDGALSFTAPDDGDYTVMYYFMQGTAHRASPAVCDSYTINYFDRRGVEALKRYLEDNVLNDPALNEKIRAGDVQYFMDSLEYSEGAGITAWTEHFADAFRARKGYDILPYLFLAHRAPRTSIWDWNDNADLLGTMTLTDLSMNKRILNDLFDVQTKLYLEDFIVPFRAWLNARGITLRAQISYGKNLEISEPIAYVDRPETENRNQKNQPDMYRLWSGGAHLQNKVLSAETGGLNDSNYNYTLQRHLHEAYQLYAAGCARIIWHIWSSCWGPSPVWPGYEGGNGMDIFYKFGTREPSFDGYRDFNEHLGRIQKLLRTGKPAVDIGMPYTKYGQHLVYSDCRDWLAEHEPMFFPSCTLQDSGYTYDYFNPALLSSDGVTFDAVTGTVEPAGYRALVLWQAELSLDGAKNVCALAAAGLPVVLVDGAAVHSPYYAEDDRALAARMEELLTYPHVRRVPTADGVRGALESLGILPNTAFASENRNLLTQMRRDGEHRLLYVYNYADGISTSLSVEGRYTPCRIDAWTGEVTRMPASYVHGRTEFACTLPGGDIALYCLEPHTEDIPLPAVPERRIKASSAIRGWTLTLESWTPSEEILTRTETLLGVTTTEYAVRTEKQTIDTALDTVTAWDSIPAIGRTVCGRARYRATFVWDGDADGAYLDLGDAIVQYVRVKINGADAPAVNLIRPRTDISALLQKGENTVELYYCSNLNNLQIARGKVTEGLCVNNFPGYLTKYEAYGPTSVSLVAYDSIGADA